MTTNPIGLYVHIPFCVRKCNYCDFCSFNLSTVSWREEYVDRLVGEILSYAGREIEVNTLFFGGGTPSLLTPSEFDKICSAIRESFILSPDCEFTIEANPKTLDREKLGTFVKNGANRISIGLQSIHENELKTLGRIHYFEDFLASYKLCRELGIENINIDLMYAIPEQTIESFSKTLDAVLELKPQHISLYGLILEEGTPFYKMKSELALPGEDIECDMYFLAAKKLSEAGYSHYEISNYALPGSESRHNLKYWRCQEYIGVGLSAYSFFKGSRFGNTDDVSAYLSSDPRAVLTEERSNDDLETEFIMLALRLREGLSLSEYKSCFGKDFMSEKRAKAENLLNMGLLKISGDRLSLTEKGFYVSNSIICELI